MHPESFKVAGSVYVAKLVGVSVSTVSYTLSRVKPASEWRNLLADTAAWLSLSTSATSQTSSPDKET